MDWFLYDNGLRHERVKALQKGNIFCTNDELEDTQIQVFNIFSFKEPLIVYVIPDTRYIRLIPVFHGKSYYGIGRLGKVWSNNSFVYSNGSIVAS